MKWLLFSVVALFALGCNKITNKSTDLSQLPGTAGKAELQTLTESGIFEGRDGQVISEFRKKCRHEMAAPTAAVTGQHIRVKFFGRVTEDRIRRRRHSYEGTRLTAQGVMFNESGARYPINRPRFTRMHIKRADSIADVGDWVCATGYLNRQNELQLAIPSMTQNGRKARKSEFGVIKELCRDYQVNWALAARRYNQNARNAGSAVRTASCSYPLSLEQNLFLMST